MQGLPVQNWVIPALIGVLVIVLLAIAFVYSRKRQSERLRSRFGQEYDHTVSEFGSRQKAERDLARRERQLRQLNIRPLNAEERHHFSERWRAIQSDFVDDPRLAVFDADKCVAEVLRARGFPTDNLDERFDDVSAAYPNIISNYREGWTILRRKDRELNTEDLRQAMVHYRDVFDQLFREDHHEEFRRVS